MLNGKTPCDIARMVHFGKIKSWLDDYIRFDAYGNLESTYAIDFDSEFDEIVEQWLEENLV